MTANISVPEDAYQDLHMFHAYVGGDTDRCPCDECVSDRADEFEDMDARAEFEAGVHDDHDYAVENWTEAIRRTEPTPAEQKRMRALHQEVNDTYAAYQDATARRAEFIASLHAIGMSYARIAEIIGVHASAAHQAAKRVRTPKGTKTLRAAR